MRRTPGVVSCLTSVGDAVQRDLADGGGCAEPKDRSAMQVGGIATATEQVQPASRLGLEQVRGVGPLQAVSCTAEGASRLFITPGPLTQRRPSATLGFR